MRAIAFDLDGTLFDHEGAARAAVRAWVCANGWDDKRTVAEAEAEWFVIEDRRFAEYAAGLVGLQEQRRRRLRDFLPYLGVELDERRIDEIYAQFLELYEAQWIGYPDAVATLTELSERGYVLAVLTNGHFEQQRGKLAAIGLLDVVEHLLASADLPAFKPDPRAYQALCAALSLAPHEIAYVGDDVVNDAHGARDAGLRSIHLDRSGAIGPLPGVETVRELADLLTQFP